MDADEAAFFLASSAVPYRSDLISPNFSRRFLARKVRHVFVTRENNRSHAGSFRVTRRFQRDCPCGAGELEHRVGSEIVPVRSGMGLVQSPNQPVTVRTPERFELIFLRRSRENVIQELEKMLVREISNKPDIFSVFQYANVSSRRFVTPSEKR